MKQKKSSIYIIIGIFLILLNLLSQLLNYQNCLKLNSYTCSFFGTTNFFYFLGFNLFSILGIILITLYIINKIKYKSLETHIISKKKILFSTFLGLIIILLSGISLYENIQNEKLKKEILDNNDLLLQECYNLSKERYEEIFETFKECHNNSCSYPTFEKRIAIELLESEDNSKCRKWFSN